VRDAQRLFFEFSAGSSGPAPFAQDAGESLLAYAVSVHFIVLAAGGVAFAMMADMISQLMGRQRSNIKPRREID
jgi:hypothetical protein